MSTYVDTSALLKRYVEEADSSAADALLRADPALLTARHTIVEVRRNLARLLSGRPLATARAAFADDLRSISIVELDEATCESAASIAEATGARTLDALHLAAAQRVSEPGVSFLTFDLRQAQAARAIGLVVVTA
ncbi:MAG TPA: type II toxin-antitoxin system VapC family toxin [Candidatus Limnocylindrales bacterium]